MPQSGAGISRSGGRRSSAARMRAATVSGVSRVRVTYADDAEDHGLAPEAVESGEVEIGLGRFDRDLLDLRGRELGQERVAVGLVAGVRSHCISAFAMPMSCTSTSRSRRIGPTMRGTTTSAAGAPHARGGVVEIDPREGGRKAVRIALAADLAVGDDVDPGPVMVGFDRDVVKGRGSE